ncbi:hypothetical protein M422DRAFT_33641, partial [Sphaerobolus stellatus SS14]
YSSPPSLQTMNEQGDVSCLTPDSYTSGGFILKIPRPSSIELARQRWREDGEEYLDAPAQTTTMFYATYKRNYSQDNLLPCVVSSLYLAGSGPEFVTAKDKLRPE